MRKYLLPMNANTHVFSILKIVPLLLIFNAGSVLAAFEWPWQQAAEQKARNSNVTPSPSPSPVMANAKDQSSDAVQKITKDPALLKPEAVVQNRPFVPQPKLMTLDVKSMPGAENKSASVQPKFFTIVTPKRNANYEEAVKMQAKLNDLIHVTSDMDRLNRSKVSAVQSMVEKARVNENLLKTLAAPGDVTSKIRKVDAEQILLSKKLRGIREAAEKQMELAQSNKDSVLPKASKPV